MTSERRRETVVIVDEPGRSAGLRDGLAQRWVVLEPRLNDLDPGAEDQVAAAIAPLASGSYGLIGVSSAASVVIRHALQSPQSVSALILVSPMAIPPERRSTLPTNWSRNSMKSSVRRSPCLDRRMARSTR